MFLSKPFIFITNIANKWMYEPSEQVIQNAMAYKTTRTSLIRRTGKYENASV